MSVTRQLGTSRATNGRKVVTVKDVPRSRSPIQQKLSMIKKFFSIKSTDIEGNFFSGENPDPRRRNTVQMEMSMCCERLSLAVDSDEAMMAKASADCLVDQPEKIFLTKPRSSSTNSSPNPSKTNRRPVSNLGRNTLSPEINGNGAECNAQKSSSRKSSPKSSTKQKQSEPLVSRNRPGSGRSSKIEQISNNNNNQKSSSSSRATSSKSSTSAGRFQGRLQRGNRFANSGGSGGSGRSFTGGSFKRRSMKMANSSMASAIKVDVTQPLTFPNTPETILEYHKRKPILDENEEWLIVELNEYECLVDGLDILKIIAKHSKFFEVEPDELWQEFFDFVDEVPAYDEVVNFDIWQEFRDKRYAC